MTIRTQGVLLQTPFLHATMADESKTNNSEPLKQLNLLVFGGTGPTGQEVVRQALELGHQVSVIARDPTKLQTQHENLKVVKGDAYHVETFESEVNGKDAVLSCLGSTAVGPFATTTLYSDTMKVILEAMKKCGVSRLIVMTSWCTRKEPTNPRYIEWFLRPMIFKGSLADMAVMEEMIVKAEMNYTIVRPPRLTHGPATGKYLFEEGLFVTTGSTRQKASRADIAHFMLSTLQTDEYDRKEFALGNL